MRFVWVFWTIWALIAIAALVLLEHERAPSTFFYDEWGFVQFRRGWSWSGWWAPHAGHLVAVPAFIYRVLFSSFGLTHYRVFRIVGLLSHLLVATMVVTYVRSRVGAIGATAAGLVVALLGAGWQNIYFPFSLAQTLPLGVGIGAWLLVERGQRRSDRAASVLLLLAVLSNGIGVSMAAGGAAQLAVRREWKRMGSVVGPAAVVYVLWFLIEGGGQGGPSNIPRMPRFAIDMVSGGAAGLFGRDLGWGHLLFGVLLGAALVIRRPMLAAVAPLGMLLANVLITGWARADIESPTASRYTYTATVMLLLVVADVARVLPPPRWARVVVVGLAVISVWGNWAVLQRGALGLRIDSSIAGAELRAVEWARATVDPMFEPDHRRMPTVYATYYLAAVDAAGSPAWSDTQLLASDDQFLRSLVDHVSVGALRVVEDARPTEANPDEQCADGAGPWQITGGDTVRVVGIDAPVEVRLHRLSSPTYSGSATEPDFLLGAGEAVEFTVPVDDAPTQTWVVALTTDGQSCTSR